MNGARIDLVWIGGGEPPSWSAGEVLRAQSTPHSVAQSMGRAIAQAGSEACLFWSDRLAPPDPRRVAKALASPGDLWHAGLRLGMGGLPRSIDYVAPTWMLNRDPDAGIEATSWRISLDACLMKTEVLRRIGTVRPEFQTLEGAALEFGHRCVRAGVLTRHLGWLAGEAAPASTPRIPIDDEMRFLYYRFGKFWTRWALVRGVLTGHFSSGTGFAALQRVTKGAPPPNPDPFRAETTDRSDVPPVSASRVTILIPTVDRYPYLEKLLEQLRRQTIPPLEVVIVDQTAADRRRENLAAEFPDLPIRLFHLDRAGQCSSRNTGLAASRGDYVLFLDDDDEVPPDLIEKHLVALERFRNDVSCGVADEDGAGPLPAAFRLTRTSDVFPTNNSMIRKSALAGSGLFDLAYDRGARADADLGMRLYLAGNLMVLNSDIHVLHRHAPSGGLRTHGARVITYASSRKRIWHRHVPATTEIYLARRYFSAAQVREMFWLGAVGTFAVRGGAGTRILKLLASSLSLPDTMWKLRKRSRLARELLSTHPQIPQLQSSALVGPEGGRA